MKLESLKSSKFDAFKSNELLDTINIVGGRYLKTLHHGNSDCVSDHSENDIHFTDGGRSYDYCYLTVPASEPVEAEEFEEIVSAGSCCGFNEGDAVVLQYYVSFNG